MVPHDKPLLLVIARWLQFSTRFANIYGGEKNIQPATSRGERGVKERQKSLKGADVDALLFANDSYLDCNDLEVINGLQCSDSDRHNACDQG